MRPKFIQENCTEGAETDLRQAELILKHRPDIILFELPAGSNGPATIFNKYEVNKKPFKKVTEIIKKLKQATKRYPYAKSDIVVWENIMKLWKQNHNIYIFNIDAPKELRKKYSETLEPKYPQARQDWLFWVYLYIREKYMAKNIAKILENYKGKEKPVIAVFLQSIHWNHVKFLLKNPKESEIFRYYFGRFPRLKKETLGQKIKKRSPLLYRYWQTTKNIGN